MSETVNDTGERRRWRARRTAVAALVAVLALLAGACGGSDDAETSEDSGAAASQAASEEGFDGDDSGGDPGGETAAEAPSADTAADTDRETSADEERAVAEGDGGDAAADVVVEGSDGLGSGGATVTPTAADLGRKLIFTAYLTVGVDDVAAAGAEATEIIQGMGGFLFGQNTQGGAEPVSELTQGRSVNFFV